MIAFYQLYGSAEDRRDSGWSCKSARIFKLLKIFCAQAWSSPDHGPIMVVKGPQQSLRSKPVIVALSAVQKLSRSATTSVNVWRSLGDPWVILGRSWDDMAWFNHDLQLIARSYARVIPGHMLCCGMAMTMIKDHDLSPLAISGRTFGAHRMDLVCPQYVHRTGGDHGLLGSILYSVLSHFFTNVCLIATTCMTAVLMT